MPHPLQKRAIPALFRYCRALWLLTAVFTFAAAAQDSRQAIDPALEEQASADQDAQRSQRTINDLDDEISLSTAENRLATQELGRLKIYNANLASIVADQEREKVTLQRQIDEFGTGRCGPLADQLQERPGGIAGRHRCSDLSPRATSPHSQPGAFTGVNTEVGVNAAEVARLTSAIRPKQGPATRRCAAGESRHDDQADLTQRHPMPARGGGHDRGRRRRRGPQSALLQSRTRW